MTLEMLAKLLTLLAKEYMQTEEAKRLSASLQGKEFTEKLVNKVLMPFIEHCRKSPNLSEYDIGCLRLNLAVVAPVARELLLIRIKFPKADIRKGFSQHMFEGLVAGFIRYVCQVIPADPPPKQI